MRTILASIALSLLAVWGYLHFAAPQTATAAKPETAFDRVMRTGTLRCGYYVFPPMLNFDEETRKPYGLGVDIIEAIAAKTSLKMEWTEEVNFGNWVPGLMTKRYDAICLPMWPTAAMAREARFGAPIMYAAMWPFAKAGDKRFDGNPESMNQPNVTIAVMEGNTVLELVNALFPKAKQHVIPGNADYGLAVEAVRTGKADVFLWDSNGAFQYQRNNPNTLHRIALEEPLQIMPFALVAARGEHDLIHLLDTGLQDLATTGALERLISKWEPEQGMFLRLPKLYR